MQPSKVYISATFDVNMTELRSLLETLIPEKYRIPFSSITLSFRDSSTGPTRSVTLDISEIMNPATLSVSWNDSQPTEKSGAEPTS